MTRVTRSPISIESLLATVQGPDRGGTCVFLGTVRGEDDVTGIEYSAYEDMAIAEIERMLAEARARWPDTHVSLQHRLGLVPLGEASVIVAASAAHREEAFAGAREIIDRVKAEVPIWKKEVEAGAARWVEGKPVGEAREHVGP